METLLPVLVALALIFVAWKVLKGLVKMAALVVIVGLAAWFWFGGMA